MFCVASDTDAATTSSDEDAAEGEAPLLRGQPGETLWNFCWGQAPDAIAARPRRRAIES